MRKAVLGLGSNLGDRLENLRGALQALGALPHTRLLASSPVYETEPVGYTAQPLFLNAAALVETGLSPHALLGACLGIEAAKGRVRTLANGPRVLDIDVLLMEGISLNEEELTLPHPRMGERAFVLAPLADLFPDGFPLGFDFAAASIDVPRTGIRRLAGPL